MPRKKPMQRRPRGRPAYDPLSIYLFVEAGRRNQKMSAYAFCMRFSLVFGRYRNAPNEGYYDPHPTWWSVSGRTLYARYMQAKRQIFNSVEISVDVLRSSGWPAASANNLEPRIEEMREALKGFSFRDLFPYNKVPSLSGVIKFSETGYEQVEPPEYNRPG